MKHIHETSASLVKSGILRTSVYNVYGRKNEFVESVTRILILRMRSLGQNGPLRRSTVFAVARITCILQIVSCVVHYKMPLTQTCEKKKIKRKNCLTEL